LQTKLVPAVEEEGGCQDEDAVSCQDPCGSLFWCHLQNLHNVMHEVQGYFES